MPVPVNATVCGLPAALSTNRTCADITPAPDGENVTSTTHAWPGATSRPEHASPATANCPGASPASDTAPGPNTNGASPVFVTVTARFPDTEPTNWSPKPSVPGSAEKAACLTAVTSMSGTATASTPPAPSTTVTSAVNVPGSS